MPAHELHSNSHTHAAWSHQAPPSAEQANSSGVTDADTAARKPAGSVVYWGNNIVNQEDVVVPDEAAKGNSVVALAAGSQHALALLRGGRVVAWGSDDLAGRENAAVPDDVKKVGAKSVAAGQYFSVALLKDGRVVCWAGSENAGAPCRAPVLPQSGPGAVASVSVAGDLVIASANDGRQYVWTSRGGIDGRENYRIISQPSGIQRVVYGSSPNSVSLLVWDKQGRLTQRNDPYYVPWELQLPSSGKSVVSACSGGKTYAAALTSDGRVTVGWRVCR
jgi:alpha-tubulin suppressor-like RCC1 family protein